MLIKDTLYKTEVKWHNAIKVNFSKLSFVHGGQRYLIKCLYAPNKDSTEIDNENESTKFFKEVFDYEYDEDFQNCILAGDYNVALEHDKDTSGYLNTLKLK